ncbi:hypothetical protein D3C87_1055760 [compost metagenome]
MRHIPHRLIDLSDAAFEARVAKYVKKYFWLARKENRFSYTASDGYMDFGMFDAYDAGVKDYAEYIRENDFVAKEYVMGVKRNHTSAAHRTARLRTPIRAKRVAIRAKRVL